MKLSTPVIEQKLNGKVEFTQKEIEKTIRTFAYSQKKKYLSIFFTVENGK